MTLFRVSYLKPGLGMYLFGDLKPVSFWSFLVTLALILKQSFDQVDVSLTTCATYVTDGALQSRSVRMLQINMFAACSSYKRTLWNISNLINDTWLIILWRYLYITNLFRHTLKHVHVDVWAKKRTHARMHARTPSCVFISTNPTNDLSFVAVQIISFYE